MPSPKPLCGSLLWMQSTRPLGVLLPDTAAALQKAPLLILCQPQLKKGGKKRLTECFWAMSPHPQDIMATESQSWVPSQFPLRIPGSLGWNGSSKVIQINPCHGREHCSVKQIAGSPIQPDAEHLQGWGIHSSSGEPVSVSHDFCLRRFCLVSNLNLPSQSLELLPHRTRNLGVTQQQAQRIRWGEDSFPVLNLHLPGPYLL